MSLVEYTNLKFDIYKSLIVRVNYREQVLNKLREFFYSQDILGEEWEKSTDINISVSTKMNHIRNQIDVIDNGDKKE